MFTKNFARNYEKKIILGTSDAWSTSHLSQRTSKPAYYIVDCQISNWEAAHRCAQSKKRMTRLTIHAVLLRARPFLAFMYVCYDVVRAHLLACCICYFSLITYAHQLHCKYIHWKYNETNALLALNKCW